MQPSVVTLVEPLIRATQAGTVHWTVDPTGGYIVQIGPNQVNVYHRPQTGIRILGDGGDVVDWLRENEPPEVFERVASLYNLADRQTRHVDRVVTDILQQLGEPVGPFA